MTLVSTTGKRVAEKEREDMKRTGRGANKLFAALLALVMLFCMVPFTAVAEVPVDSPVKDQIARQGNLALYDAYGNSSEDQDYDDDPWVAVSKTVTDSYMDLDEDLGYGLDENGFVVTLEIWTKKNVKDVVVTPDIATTLVIDCSASMFMDSSVDDATNEAYQTPYNGTNSAYPVDPGGAAGSGYYRSRMCELKDALGDFAEEYRDIYERDADGEFVLDGSGQKIILPESERAERWISVVLFDSHGIAQTMGGEYWVNISTDTGFAAFNTLIFGNAAGTHLMNGKTDGSEGISPVAISGSLNTMRGCTNFEAGLAVARNLFGVDGSNNSFLPSAVYDRIVNCNVILFTDGTPSFYGANVNNYDTAGVTSFTTGVLALGTSTEHITRAKKRVNEIQEGSSTRLPADVFAIGYADSKDAEIIDNIDAQVKDAITLKGEFSNIITQITSAYTNAWLLTDPMGANIIFEGFIGEEESDFLDNYPQLTLATNRRSFTWNLRGKEGTEVDASDYGLTVDWDECYYYTLSYKVTLDTIGAKDVVDAFDSDYGVPTNGETFLYYRAYEEDRPLTRQNQLAIFEVPYVYGYNAPLTFYKEDDYAGRRLNGYVFAIHKGTNEVRRETSGKFSGDDGVVRFTGSTAIPSGHTYTMKELATNPYAALYDVDTDATIPVSVSWGELTSDISNGVFKNKAHGIYIPLEKYFVCLGNTFMESEGDIITIRTFVCLETEHKHSIEEDCYDKICGEPKWDLAPEDATLHEHSDECYDRDEEGNILYDEETGEPLYVCGEPKWDIPPKHHVCSDDCYELVCGKLEHTHDEDCWADLVSESYTFEFTLTGTGGNGYTYTITLTLTKQEILALMEAMENKEEDAYAKSGFLEGKNSFYIPLENIGNGEFTVTERIIGDSDDRGWTLGSCNIDVYGFTDKVLPAIIQNSYGEFNWPNFVVLKYLDGVYDETFRFELYDVTDEDNPKLILDDIQITNSGYFKVNLPEYINEEYAVLQLSEVKGSTVEMDYDDYVFTIFVIDGVAYADLDGANRFTSPGFYNTYYKPNYGEFTIAKTVAGDDGWSGSFNFALSIEGSTWEIPDTKETPVSLGESENPTIKVNGNDSVTISLETLGKRGLNNFTGSITVRETGGGSGDGKWTYDGTVYSLYFIDGEFQYIEPINDEDLSTGQRGIARFTNTFERTRPTPPNPTALYGSLTIYKTVAGLDELPEDYVAWFVVTGTNGYSNTVSVGANSSVTISGLTPGVTYTVTESEANTTRIEGYAWTVIGSGGTATVAANQDRSVTVTNSYTLIVSGDGEEDDETTELIIDETPPPLAALPEDPEDEEEFEDPDTPLSELPRTGADAATQAAPLPLIGFGASLMALGLMIKGKKKEDSAD